MKKRDLGMLFLVLSMSAATVFLASCNNDDGGKTSSNPFDVAAENTGNLVRDKIVVISDIHLGGDTTYSECVKHLPRLKQFLTEVRESKTVKELVIAGDMLDEWYVPSRKDTYEGGTQKDFVRKIAKENKIVVDELNLIIKDKNIKVTYVPGNHDLLISEENVDDILPGVNQVRDASKPGIGTYHPDGYPQIAIEHSHRYDFFCSPDPYSNQDIAPGSIIPPGYFFARIAVNSVTNYPVVDKSLPREVKLNSSDSEQVNNYNYYRLWKAVLTDVIPVKDDYDEDIIVTNIEKYTQTFAINDVLPYNTSGGKIDMTLFSGSCNELTWEKRQAYNNVPVMTKAADAIPGALKSAFTDEQANQQYFQNKNSNVRIVIFGHTHVPTLLSYTSADKGDCVYANSGTWIDQKVKAGQLPVDQDVKNMNFVVVEPQANDKSMIKVELFNYHNGKHISEASRSIKL